MSASSFTDLLLINACLFWAAACVDADGGLLRLFTHRLLSSAFFSHLVNVWPTPPPHGTRSPAFGQSVGITGCATRHGDDSLPVVFVALSQMALGILYVSCSGNHTTIYFHSTEPFTVFGVFLAFERLLGSWGARLLAALVFWTSTCICDHLCFFTGSAFGIPQFGTILSILGGASLDSGARPFIDLLANLTFSARFIRLINQCFADTFLRFRGNTSFHHAICREFDLALFLAIAAGN